MVCLTKSDLFYLSECNDLPFPGMKNYIHFLVPFENDSNAWCQFMVTISLTGQRCASWKCLACISGVLVLQEKVQSGYDIALGLLFSLLWCKTISFIQCESCWELTLSSFFVSKGKTSPHRRDIMKLHKCTCTPESNLFLLFIIERQSLWNVELW